MALYFAEIVATVKELLDQKSLLGRVGATLSDKEERRLAELRVVSFTTAYGLAERGLSQLELKLLHLFTVKETGNKLSKEIFHCAVVRKAQLGEQRIDYFFNTFGFNAIT